MAFSLCRRVDIPTCGTSPAGVPVATPSDAAQAGGPVGLGELDSLDSICGADRVGGGSIATE